MREHTRWTLRTGLSTTAVIDAITDFGPDRARIWPETSHPAVYVVHEVGDTWAVATEGVPHAWSRERYDWSEAGRVTLEQLDSNVALPGGRIEYTVTGVNGGGSSIACDRQRTFRGTPRGVIAGTYMRLFGPIILRRQFEGSLRRVQASGQ